MGVYYCRARQNNVYSQVAALARQNATARQEDSG
jgi:hypothetical protein